MARFTSSKKRKNLKIQKNNVLHRYSCVKCLKRTDKVKNVSKNRRLIRLAWMKDLFLSLNVNLKVYKYVCVKCYNDLIEKHKNNTIFQAHIRMKQFPSPNVASVNNQFIETLSSERCMDLMGVNKNDFEDLCSLISDNEWDYDACKKTCIGLYLIRLRTGSSIKKIVASHNVSSYSKCVRMIHKARNVLFECFVGKFFGIKHLTRGILNIEHTTELSRHIFDVEEDSTISVWDGTYIYIEKSSNYTFQKSTYSVHKNRNLLKMMMVVSTTGFIIDYLNFVKRNLTEKWIFIHKKIKTTSKSYQENKNQKRIMIIRNFLLQG